MVWLVNRIIVTNIFLLLLFATACDRKPERMTCLEYPKQIDSLGVRDLYDTARLYLLTWLCDKRLDGYYRGQFELKYTSFFSRHDSLELRFIHSLKSRQTDSTDFDEYKHFTSMIFNIKTRKKLWGWDINGFSDALRPGDERFENARTEKVLQFVNAHQEILDTCFWELLKKEKMLIN
jgi:hypothetical protein